MPTEEGAIVGESSLPRDCTLHLKNFLRPATGEGKPVIEWFLPCLNHFHNLCLLNLRASLHTSLFALFTPSLHPSATRLTTNWVAFPSPPLTSTTFASSRLVRHSESPNVYLICKQSHGPSCHLPAHCWAWPRLLRPKSNRSASSIYPLRSGTWSTSNSWIETSL